MQPSRHCWTGHHDFQIHSSQMCRKLCWSLKQMHLDPMHIACSLYGSITNYSGAMITEVFQQQQTAFPSISLQVIWGRTTLGFTLCFKAVTTIRTGVIVQWKPLPVLAENNYFYQLFLPAPLNCQGLFWFGFYFLKEKSTLTHCLLRPSSQLVFDCKKI